MLLHSLLLTGILAGQPATVDQLQAGFAARTVNPTRPAATIGHRVMRLFDNVYCDLRVQAMALADAKNRRAVWMGCDFCIVHRSVVDRIKAEIQRRYQVPPEAICINASHTHSAPPLTEGEAVLPEHFDAQYADVVVRQAVAVVGDALARLEPATLRYSEDQCPIAWNRRVYDAEGRHVRDHCPWPPGVVDPSVQVLAARRPSNGQLIGTVVKFAGHPVVVVDLGIGSDYPGFMRRSLESERPGSVALFLQGCCGDLVARRPNATFTGFAPSSFEMAEGLGRQLADSVRRALEKPGVAITGPIEARLVEVPLPVQKVPLEEYQEAARRNDPFAGAWGKTYSQMHRQGKPIPTNWPFRIQAFRLGDGPAPFTLVALGGEVFCEYGLNLRRVLPPAAVVLGYSNGVEAYLPTAKVIGDGGYEPKAFRWWRLPGPYSPEVESIVLKAAAELARP